MLLGDQDPSERSPRSAPIMRAAIPATLGAEKEVPLSV